MENKHTTEYVWTPDPQDTERCQMCGSHWLLHDYDEQSAQLYCPVTVWITQEDTHEKSSA